jgi:osmotically-inducible protein OsmY
MKSVGPIVAALMLALAGCDRGDEQLTKQVRESLDSDRTPAAQYDVRTKDHIVTLEGVVETEADRDRLIENTRRVKGVLGVDNRLTVRAPVQVTGAGDIAFNPEDRAIKDAVRQRLNAGGIAGVWLDVREGVVTMQGEVPRGKHADALRAAQEASPAIKRIDDLLVVR